MGGLQCARLERRRPRRRDEITCLAPRDTRSGTRYAPRMEIDFARFVEGRRARFDRDRPGDSYAFSVDRRLLEAMRALRPVELAVSSTVRLGKGLATGDLLGTAVKVGPSQFPRVHAIVLECADTLGIVQPTVFVQGRIDSLNAWTTGTDRESIIVLHAATVDALDDDALRFVVGHECGHIQNGHVVYLSALRMLTDLASAVFGWFVRPALLALQRWSRAAEVTCDRAGLLCCKDVNVGQRALLELVVGSARLFRELDVESYLDQLREGREGLGRAVELVRSHPYVPKRLEAMRLFAQSERYRRSVGLEGGRALADVDHAVEDVLQVVAVWDRAAHPGILQVALA